MLFVVVVVILCDCVEGSNVSDELYGEETSTLIIGSHLVAVGYSVASQYKVLWQLGVWGSLKSISKAIIVVVIASIFSEWHTNTQSIYVL